MRLASIFVLVPSLAFAGDAALDCTFLQSNANCVKPAMADLQTCAPPHGEIGKLAPAAKKSTDNGSCTFSNGVTVSWKRTKTSQTVSFAKDGKMCATYEHTRSAVPPDETQKLTVPNGAVVYKEYDEPKSKGDACTANCQQSLTCPNGQRYVAPRPFPTELAECFGELDFSGDLVVSPVLASLTLAGSDEPIFECNPDGSPAPTNTADNTPQTGSYVGSFSNGQGKTPEMKTQQDGAKIRVKQNGQDVGYIKVEPERAEGKQP